MAVAFFDPAQAVGRATIVVEVVGRDKVPVANGEFGEEAVVLGKLRREFEELGPQEFGGAEYKDINRFGEGERVDRRHRSTDNDQGISGTAVAPPPWDSCGVEGADEVDGIEFEAAAPSKKVERSERGVVFEGAS